MKTTTTSPGRAQRVTEAARFLASYHLRYGYYPGGQSLGRFGLLLEEVVLVWETARKIVDAREEDA